jgi:sigma-B regulation protein RsbU (phosphoserine phosphatase)
LPTSSAASGPRGENQDRAFDAFVQALAGDDAESLYDRAPCGYLTTTPDGLIVKVNQTFLAWTGYDRNDLVGRRRFVDLLTAGGRMYHETHYAPMLGLQGTAREIALDIVCDDGQRLPALVNSVLERDSAGRPVVVRTAVFDATQRREYERELVRQRQRAEASERRATALAHTLQQTLIPPTHPQIPGLDLAAAYRPAGDGSEVGGDFYDVFEINANDWCLVIGDVCGKGVEAAVVTALARYTLRAAAAHQMQPSDALRTLNRVLLEHDSDRFCTVSVLRLRYELGGWSATFSCGGHPLPYVISRETPPRTVGRPGSLLGVVEAPSFFDTTISLRAGDTVVLYTDGITEGRGTEEGFYGEARLAQSLSRHHGTATSLTEGLLREVLEFQSDRPRDDIAVVVVRVPDG